MLERDGGGARIDVEPGVDVGEVGFDGVFSHAETGYVRPQGDVKVALRAMPKA